MDGLDGILTRRGMLRLLGISVDDDMVKVRWWRGGSSSYEV